MVAGVVMLVQLLVMYVCVYVFFFKQKTAYEMRISDWSSDVCSSDLRLRGGGEVELGDARKEQEDDMGRAVGHADGPSLAWITQARGSHRSRFPMGLHLQRQSRDGISLARAAGRRKPIRRRR